MNDETKSLIPLSKASLENCSNLVKFSEISCCERRVEDVVTVTRVKEGEVTTICGNCFEKVKEEDKKAKWERNPTKVGECLLCCQTKVVRENKDLASWVCDDCMKLQEGLEEYRSNKDVTNSFPDEIAKNLYLGPKESAANPNTFLPPFHITNVLVCGRDLPTYHFPQPQHLPPIRYHRLPLADSLSEDIIPYLLAAFSFISSALLRGERVLVHCNAGVSRSGGVVVGFLREAGEGGLGGRVEDVLGEVKKRRGNVCPNSRFMEDLKTYFGECH